MHRISRTNTSHNFYLTVLLLFFIEKQLNKLLQITVGDVDMIVDEFIRYVLGQIFIGTIQLFVIRTSTDTFENFTKRCCVESESIEFREGNFIFGQYLLVIL